MKDSIKWAGNRMPKSDDRQLAVMALSNVAKARFFPSIPLPRWPGWTAWPSIWALRDSM